MNISVPIKICVPLILPVALFIFLVLLFALYSGTSNWPEYAPFLYLPYILLGVAFLLGVFFSHSRVSFICPLLAVIAFLVNDSFFVKTDPVRGEAVIFLSTIYVPALTALFYHLGERGIFTVHGGIRGLVIFSAVLAVLLLPGIRELGEAVSSAQSVLWGCISDLFRIPMIGVLVLIVCVPFFFIRNQHESPLLGPMFCLSLLFVFVGLNFRSSLWRPGQEHTVMLSFMSGAAVTLAWAVMESSWRSAHMDELTDLPGRRSLKHHFGSLGSSYAIAVLDIDHFKKINDRYGHDTGDEVLRFVAGHLRRSTAGRAYRYGGEEFVIVSEGDAFDDTVSGLEELRKAICRDRFGIRGKGCWRRKPKQSASTPSRSTQVTLDQRPTHRNRATEAVTVTVSIGAARSSRKYSSPSEVLEAADKALYQAKKDGRNNTKVVR